MARVATSRSVRAKPTQRSAGQGSVWCRSTSFTYRNWQLACRRLSGRPCPLLNPRGDRVGLPERAHPRQEGDERLLCFPVDRGQQVIIMTAKTPPSRRIRATSANVRWGSI